MKLITLGLAGLLAAGTVQSAGANTGAGLGALLGGVAGGVIGHQSKEAAAGAAIGAVTGAIVGYTVDEARPPSRRVAEYRSAPDPWRRQPSRTVIYHDRGPRPVIVHAPRREPVVVVVGSTPPPPTVIVHAPPVATCLADEHGYTSADYLALMTPSEVALLRQRAYGAFNVDLAAYLTMREKINLRARAANQVVIGAS